jgi:hypothetical protein
MRKTVLLGALILALASGIYLSSQATAGGDKAVQQGVLKIAALLKKGDKDAAKSEAQALAKKVDELEDLMNVFKPRKKGGIGVGATPGGIIPDGIEQKLITLGRDAPGAAAMAKEASALEDMGYVIAAVAEVSKAKAPKQNMGKKTIKDWNTWSNDMHDAGIKLAEAAKAKGAQDVKTTSAKVNASCNNCHSTFRN